MGGDLTLDAPFVRGACSVWSFSTANPAYAAAGPNAGEVSLGGIDSTSVNGMSGGWRRSFVLDAAATVRVTLSYQLELSASYKVEALP